MLSNIEKIIFLKKVFFFRNMTIEQLGILADVCDEVFFPADEKIYVTGDPGGVLYIVVNGLVAIEVEKRKGYFTRLATMAPRNCFGEMSLFDNSERKESALAISDTSTLRLRREPIIDLARRHPGLSLELINVLSAKLRETNDRVAELTKTRSRKVHNLFDQLDF